MTIHGSRTLHLDAGASRFFTKRHLLVSVSRVTRGSDPRIATARQKSSLMSAASAARDELDKLAKI